MIQRSERGPVVVGVDGSGSALDALDWAAAEAATRHRPLRVVHLGGDALLHRGAHPNR